MAPALLVAGLALVSLPGAARRLGRRIPSAEWAQLCVVALVGGAVMVEVGTLLIAAPTVLRAVGVPALAQACDRLVGPLVPLGPVGGWSAAVVAALLPPLAVHGWRRAQAQVRGLAIEPSLGEHHRADGYELVILPTAERLAYSVADPAPQVVLSQGLVASLTDAQVRAVIRHERAHLTHGHPRLLLVAAAARRALAVWPAARWSYDSLRMAVERWADDEATREGPSQRRALREALLTVAVGDLADAVPAFSLADATLERVAAMDHQPRAHPAMHLALYLPGAAGAAVAVAALGSWAHHARVVLAMAGRCTI